MTTVVMPRGWRARDWVRTASNRNLTWTDCVAEWIDNSIGNGATRIDLWWLPRMVAIRDNGMGCTPKMFAAMVSPGWHEENDGFSNRVSRYGIGAKDGFTWCHGVTQCFSRRGGACQFIEVDWQAFDEDWDFDVPQDGEAAARKCSQFGLESDGVLIRQSHDRQMHAKAFDQIHASLSKLYWAAVETGVEIDVRFYPQGSKKKHRGGLLFGKSMPDFIAGSSIDEELQLADGRRIRIAGGILDPVVNLSDPGFEYIYGHRVVIKAGGIGSGGLDFERCYFRILLLGDKESWRVTTNKDRLHDTDEAALEQAVFDRCKPLLAQSTSGDYAALMDQDLLNDLSDSLTEANRKHAKRRPPSERSGAVEPTGTGTEHENASTTHERDGKYRKRGAPSPIVVRKGDFGENESHIVGKASVRDRLVRLNARHAFIALCFENKERQLLRNVAHALWSSAWVTNDDEKQLFHTHDFVEKFSSMLVNQSDAQLVTA